MTYENEYFCGAVEVSVTGGPAATEKVGTCQKKNSIRKWCMGRGGHLSHFAQRLSVLAFVGVACGVAIAVPRAEAAPVLRAQLVQGCDSCNVSFGPPFFTSGTFITGVPDDQPQHISVVQQGISAMTVTPPFHMVPGPRVQTRGQANAIAGAIGVLTDSSFVAQFFGDEDEFATANSAALSQATASFRTNDNLVSGPAPAGARVPFRLHLPVDGLIASSDGPSPPTASGGTGTDAIFQLNVSVNGDFRSGRIEVSHINNSTAQFYDIRGQGFFEDLEADVQFAPLHAELPILLDLALDFMVPANLFFPIDVQAFISSNAGFTLAGEGPWFQSADALNDIISTVSFPTSGPVADLAPGFSFNSVDGRVVDNRWLGAAAVAVPEPPSSLLFLSGIALLGTVSVRSRAKMARRTCAT